MLRPIARNSAVLQPHYWTERMKIKTRFADQSQRATELKTVLAVRAWVILHEGKPAGKIVTHNSGAVATATVVIFAGLLEEVPIVSAKASGYGYDKYSAAVVKALSKAVECDKLRECDGAGMSSVENWFNSVGYTLFQVV